MYDRLRASISAEPAGVEVGEGGMEIMCAR